MYDAKVFEYKIKVKESASKVQRKTRTDREVLDDTAEPVEPLKIENPDESAPGLPGSTEEGAKEMDSTMDSLKDMN